MDGFVRYVGGSHRDEPGDEDLPGILQSEHVVVEVKCSICILTNSQVMLP